MLVFEVVYLLLLPNRADEKDGACKPLCSLRLKNFPCFIHVVGHKKHWKAVVILLWKTPNLQKGSALTLESQPAWAVWDPVLSPGSAPLTLVQNHSHWHNTAGHGNVRLSRMKSRNGILIGYFLLSWVMPMS